MARSLKRSAAGSARGGNADASDNIANSGIADKNDATASTADAVGAAAADTTGATNPAAATGGYTEPVPTFAAGTDTGTINTGTPRKRGRPPGSTNRAKEVPLSVSGIETLLLGIHTTLLHATGAPEFELSPEEANQLSKAYCDVALHYPSLALAPNVAAIVNLGTTVSIVYGSRFAAYRMRRAMEKTQRRSSPLAAAPTATSPAAPAGPSQHLMPQPEYVNGNPRQEPRTMPQEMRRSTIPGVGDIEFPPDHEILKGKPN